MVKTRQKTQAGKPATKTTTRTPLEIEVVSKTIKRACVAWKLRWAYQDEVDMPTVEHRVDISMDEAVEE